MGSKIFLSVFMILYVFTIFGETSAVNEEDNETAYGELMWCVCYFFINN